MEKTFALCVRCTSGRSLRGLPDDETIVTSFGVPSRHVWGTYAEGAINQASYFDADVIWFNTHICEPLRVYLEKHGIDVDFSGVARFDLEPHDVLCVRADWYHSTDKHSYTIIKSDDGTQTQIETRYDKRGNLRGTSCRAVEIDGMVVEAKASGAVKARTHTALDIYPRRRKALERAINTAIAANFGGHVRVSLTPIGSVNVGGTV